MMNYYRKAIQNDWQCEYDAEMEDYVRVNRKYQMRVRAWEQQFIQHCKNSKKYPEPTHPGDGPVKPILKRIIVNDTRTRRCM